MLERKEAPVQMTTIPLSSHGDTLVERILDLSADAQIKRREIPLQSIAFHELTGAIAAYGKVLGMLTTGQQSSEHYLLIKPLQYAAAASGPL